MGLYIDLTGKRFGRLLVIERDGSNKHGQVKWLCRCDCGAEKHILGMCLSRGETQSCGCLHKEVIANINKTHGMTRTPIYGLWHGMIQRCYDRNHPRFNDYGGRGINVCERWKNFQNFYADMGDKPHNKSLERLDVNGNYSPDNVVWTDMKTQANNRRTNVILEHNGKRQTMQQWCDELGLKIGTVWARLNRGWSVDRALTQEVRHVFG